MLCRKSDKPHNFNTNKFNLKQVKQKPVEAEACRSLLKPVEVLPGKLQDFWNFISFQATKTLTGFMELWPSG